MWSILKEGKANTHLTHLEELILTRGEEGYEMAKQFLLEMIKVLRGDGNTKVSTSVKWDGAPAIFAGINPDNGKFFVGTKSIFNKVPKINYTVEDIIDNHSKAKKDEKGRIIKDKRGKVDHGGLVDKLIRALKELPKLGINKNILQGDFMFDDGMLKVVDIDGEPHYRFKPNTIIYAVPVNSKLGQQIGNAKFGIVFHTTYGGVDEEGRPTNVSFGADVSRLKRRPDVWFDDALFKNDTGYVTLTDDDEERVISLVKEADLINNKINYQNLPLAKMNIYLNSEIRGGAFADDAEGSYEGFVNWNKNRIQKRINKLKSERGKQRAMAAGKADLEALEASKSDILNVFRLSRLLFEAKNIFIEKYNNAVYATKHFVDDGSGDLKVTNPEGYVAVDFAGNGVKFVDRLEFSRANFMMDKGFKKPDIKENQMLEIFWNNKKSTKMSLREWHTLLPKTRKTNKKLFEDLKACKMVTSLIPDSQNVKTLLAEAVQWAINEQEKLSSGKSIAIVPGAFKPPHLGHLGMVKTYSSMADEVVVLISSPKSQKSQRTVNGKPITAEKSKQIWDMMISEHNIPNVSVKISDSPSPVRATLEYVGKDGPLEPGTVIILGASKKGGDHKRWSYAAKYIKPGVKLIDPEVSAVVPELRGDGVPFSATDARNALSNNENADLFFGEGKTQIVRDILGLDEMQEFSAMGVGPVSGYSGPLRSTNNDTNNDEDSKLVREVLDYLFKQGILK